MNHDGAIDLVLRGIDSVVLLLGAGDGTFGAKTSYMLSFGALALGDLDGDGDLDIVNSGDLGNLSTRLNRTLKPV